MQMSPYLAGGLFAALSSATALAGELVYTPVNPNFGGSPLNSPHLLGIASAINDYKDPAASTAGRTATMADETARLLRSSLLSRISSRIDEAIFGENAQDSGAFDLAGTGVVFHRKGGQVIIEITDAATGQVTTIEAPVGGL